MAGKTRTTLIADHPLLSKMWDYENNDVNPTDYGIGNNKKFMWVCPKCKKSFHASPNSALKKCLCPECSYKDGAERRVAKKIENGDKISVADDNFLSLYWATDLNSNDPATVTNKANKLCMWYCPKCGEPFLRKVVQMKTGSGLCNKCSHNIATEKHEALMLKCSKSIADIPELIKYWDFDHNTLDPHKVSFRSNKRANWICKKCKTSFQRMINNQYISPRLCKECSAKIAHEKQRKSIATYSEMVANRPNMIALWDWDKNTRDPHDLSARSGIKVWWKCHCGKSWEERPSYRYNLLPNCMECSMKKLNDRKNKRAIKKGGTWGENNPKLAKQWHPTLNGNITPYDITPNCCKEYYFLCEYGHTYKVAPRERSERHAGCPICNSGRRTSFSEQAISYYLEKVTEAKPNYQIKNHSELDVYLPKKNAAIEFDGAYWHSHPKSVERDARKDEYCRNKSIRLIRVKEWKYNKQYEKNLIYFERKNNNYQWLINVICSELDLPHIEVDIIRDTPEIYERLNRVDVETSLAKKRSDALAYWDYKKNAPISPEKVGYTSNHVFAWHCPKCGNEFTDSVVAVTRRTHICKECGKVLKGINISKAKLNKQNQSKDKKSNQY